MGQPRFVVRGRAGPGKSRTRKPRQDVHALLAVSIRSQNLQLSRGGEERTTSELFGVARRREIPPPSFSGQRHEAVMILSSLSSLSLRRSPVELLCARERETLRNPASLRFLRFPGVDPHYSFEICKAQRSFIGSDRTTRIPRCVNLLTRFLRRRRVHLTLRLIVSTSSVENNVSLAPNFVELQMLKWLVRS